MGLFLNDKKKSHCEKLLYHGAKGRHAQHAEDAHDAPGQQHTAHTGQHALLKAHIQQRGRQSSRPRTAKEPRTSPGRPSPEAFGRPAHPFPDRR